MDFPKYRLYGDYHWQEFDTCPSYRLHVLKIVDWVKEKNGLEIGCGDGLITHKLKWQGIDTDEDGIRWAKEHGVKAELGTAYELEGKYDAVLLADTLEHLEFPEKALKEITKITDILYIVIPNQTHVEEFGYNCWNPEKFRDFMSKTDWKEVEMIVAEKIGNGESKIYAKYENSANNR